MQTLQTTHNRSCQPIWSSQLQSGAWVCLKDLPHPFAHDEALLLCKVTEGKWLTWIPNYGEYLLKTSSS